MAREVNQALREEWRRRIEAQQESGLTVAKFCRRESLSQATFYLWRRKLHSPRSKKSSGHRKESSRTKRAGRSPATPSSPFVQLPLSPPPSCPWIEVVLAEGTVIRLPQQNLAALQTVLQTLGGAPASAMVGSVKYA